MGCDRPCCHGGFERVFSEKTARDDADAYRRKGLDHDARRMRSLTTERLAAGYDVLEVGGGVGALHIELLKSGASRATNVELTSSYETVAADLLRESGFADRTDRLLGDFVEAAATVASADVVVMQRVVCCYPDVDRLVGAAAAHARRLLLMSFPVGRWWIRLGAVIGNALLALRRDTFRAYVHPLARVRAAAEREGLRLTLRERGFIWQVVVFERS